MKFQYRDDTDQALVKVITHEFSRCDFAFKLFVDLKEKTYLGRELKDSNIDLMVYNAYSLFIQHLYEYFKGCLIRDYLDTKQIPYETIDLLVNNEVNKILSNWRTLIDIGKAPSWANDRTYYEGTVPDTFGEHFRNVRNTVAHVDYRRINGGNRITLTDFFNKYHKYVVLLYFNGREWWDINGQQNLDFGDITSFNRLT